MPEGVGFGTFGPSFKAGGNVRPSRFVVLDGTYDSTVTEASTNNDVFGVSQEGVDQPPGVAGSDGYAGRSGEDMKVYGPGSICMLKIGSGGCSPGNYLKSDSAGQGVAAATTGTTAQFIGAIALETGLEGDLIRVYVIKLPKFYPALS